MTNPADNGNETTLLLHAYHDGELDPANALALERRLASDPALAAESARIAALRRVLRERLPPQAPPASLQVRIERAVGLRRADTGVSRRSLAASIIATAVLASGTTWLAVRPSPGDPIADAIVAAHLRALMAPQPIDVASSDRHTVKPWFSGRVPEAPRVVDLGQDGFPLVGGRIDVIRRAPVATLVYRHRQHLISLTAVPAPSASGSTSAAQHSLQGYNLVRWTADGITYWAASDLGSGDLETFARLFRAAPADG
jgi:anti-sigma factor RsiW